MAHLPRDARGYLVPFFVAKVDGVFDFRVADDRKRTRAVRESLCWLCGQKLGRFKCFAIGPMCAINRTSAEPPCHRDCASWAVRVCPFLIKPRMHRREGGKPEAATSCGGLTIARNPGTTLLWTCKRFSTFTTRASDGPGIADGWLCELGDPEFISAHAEGRTATREELWHSIATGIPLLTESAVMEGAEAVEALIGHVRRALSELSARGLLDFDAADRGGEVVRWTAAATPAGAR